MPKRWFRHPGRPFLPPEVARQPGDERVFYVVDHPPSRFVGNAFDADPLPFVDADGSRKELRPLQPGISFMNRPDQAQHFKLHLPWVLKTPPAVDTLYLPPINRAAPLSLLVGLVETDWYAHPVNLVVNRPPTGALHVRRGEVIAQMVFIDRTGRRDPPKLVAPAAEEAAAMKEALREWFLAHAEDRGTYRRLARSRQGVVEPEDL